jgi:pyrroline-5-carboxylate reductase
MNAIIIIGAGNMGRAMSKGLLQDPNNIIYFKTNTDSTKVIADFAPEIKQSRVFFSDDIEFFKDIQNPWIILAVKPQLVTPVMMQISDIIVNTNPKALICVAAGVTIKTIEDACPAPQKQQEQTLPIIRTMPNIAVASGHGVIGFISNTPKINHDFVTLCNPLGMVYPITDEQEFHLFTAIAGSAPAFFLHTIEAMAQAANMLGMDNAVFWRSKFVTNQYPNRFTQISHIAKWNNSSRA